MGKTLYLLSEETLQEDYECKAKHLYRSEFNKWANVFLEGKEFMYLSIGNGIILPDDIISPYEIKELSSKSMIMWSMCVLGLLGPYIKNNNIESICFLTGGNIYNRLMKLLIKKGYKVSAPIKHYTNVEIKIKWIQDKIVESINNKLKALLY